MNEITMVLFAVYAAAVSLVLYVILERVFSLKIRMILLPFCAIVFAIFVVMINPQYETGLLFMLNVILGQLLIPFFILIPLPFIEDKTGTVFRKASVFSGAFAAAIFGYIVLPAFIGFPKIPWQAETLVNMACISVVSFLIFTAIHRIQQPVSRTPEEKPVISESGKKTVPPSPKKRTILILAVCLLLLCSPLFLLDTYLRSSGSCGGFSMYRIDQEFQSPSNAINHLTDAKLRAYPKLESLIKNSHNIQQNQTITINNKKINVTDLGSIRFSCDEESYRSMSNSYLEYEGKLYYTGIAWIS